MAPMSDAARDVFLAEPMIAVLSTTPPDGPSLSVPIWFEWDGSRASFFTDADSPKMRRISADPRVSLLVANPTGEPEAWVLIEGRVEVTEGSAIDLAERLAHRYWDMDDAAHAQTVEEWRAAGDSWRLLQIVPTKIRSYG